MNTPKIRFKGFTDDWEQRKLGEIYGSIGNAFVGTATPYYVDQGHFYLESNNVKDGQINHNSEIFINDEFYEKQRDKWLHAGDMVMVQSGHVGHAAVIPKELDNTAAHALIMFRNAKEKIEPYFLNYEYQTDKTKKKIENITTGNTIKHILASDMQEFEVDIPKYEEQKIIAGYFRTIDHLITLHQRKCDETKQLKKFMLQKMFPKNGEKNPKIRFEGFTDDWEQRKLGEVVGIYDGVHQTPQYQDSGIMFLSVENITTLKSEKYISEEAFERDYKVYPEKGDILMTRIGDVGTTNVVQTKEKVAFYVSLALLKPKEINSYFLSNAMKTSVFQKGLRERTLVTAIPRKINKDEIGRVNVFITNNAEEQKKIGDYFTALDHLITLHQRKCEKLKELKKYMLHNMFV